MLRKPAVAETFYPRNVYALNKGISFFLREVDLDKQFQKTIKPLKNQDLHGLIVPHAGYFYSGQTAVYAYHLIKDIKPKKILLLGPNHTVPLAGVSFAPHDEWETPLGKVKLAKENISTPYISYEETVHLKEHCLEVQLPFIQYLFKNFRIAPAIVGELAEREIRSFAQLLKEKFTDFFIIISTDLSHYLPQKEAEKEDQKTISSIIRLDSANLNACGRFPLAVALELCRLNHWQPKLLHYSTSAEASGDASRVVGYASLLF